MNRIYNPLGQQTQIYIFGVYILYCSVQQMACKSLMDTWTSNQLFFFFFYKLRGMTFDISINKFNEAWTKFLPL